MSNTFDDESPIKENLEPLIQTLKTDPDWNKRFGAASKLFRLGQEKAIDPLINALQTDKHKEIKRFAADLLGNLGNPRATWALIAVLRESILSKDKTLIHHTSQALLKIQSTDLPGILTGTIRDTEENLSMRLKAIELLGKIKDSKSVALLIEIIEENETDGKLRAKAIEELIYTGHLAGLQLILDLLDETKHKGFQKLVVKAISNTPFKNRTIVVRISDSLLKISENEEKKQEKKDQELLTMISSTLKNLAKNIDISFNELIDEVIEIRMKQKN